MAAQRAREKQGTLIFRNQDLDVQRCRPEFVAAMYEDLRWLGIRWQEGPDVVLDSGGPFAPYSQSERREFYLKAWRELRDGGFIYPCSCSRRMLPNGGCAPRIARCRVSGWRVSGKRGAGLFRPLPLAETTRRVLTHPLE